MRRTYEHGRRAKIIALVYLGIVLLSALPTLLEEATGTADGSFSFLLVMLTTAPLILLILPFGEMVPGGAAGYVIGWLIVVTVALVQAWVIWRVLRGRATTEPGSGKAQPGRSASR
ncbi:SCO4225 family membrane protein [Ornithinimicrobium cerasi]|uniref:SCO4225 family membrane protein n=1 Tax=Ornithinimicrobium cerasi TaxID=2248773 RepID=UPI000BE430AD|nr:hypothetical protein [Ornithinimicrobium cerasi]